MSVFVSRSRFRFTSTFEFSKSFSKEKPWLRFIKFILRIFNTLYGVSEKLEIFQKKKRRHVLHKCSCAILFHHLMFYCGAVNALFALDILS